MSLTGLSGTSLLCAKRDRGTNVTNKQTK